MSNENSALAQGFPSGEKTQWVPPFKLLNGSGTSMFSVDSSGNVVAAGTIADGGSSTPTFSTLTVTGNATIGGTLGVTGAATMSSTLSAVGITDTGTSALTTLNLSGNLAINTNKFTVTASSGNTLVAGTLTVSGAVSLAGGTSSAFLDLSSIAASAAELKIAATSDTPVVTWTSNSGTTINSTAPAGYLKITVGAASRYIPFWA